MATATILDVVLSHEAIDQKRVFIAFILPLALRRVGRSYKSSILAKRGTKAEPPPSKGASVSCGHDGSTAKRLQFADGDAYKGVRGASQVNVVNQDVVFMVDTVPNVRCKASSGAE